MVAWALVTVACSQDADDPFDDAGFTAGDHGDATSASASASSSSSEGAGESADDDATGAASTSGASEDDTTAGESTGHDDGPATESASDTSTDDDDDDGDESSTTAPTVACEDLGECQPCVDCSVQPGGECQDEALACQGDAECNALANCYNGCAMQFMGDELMTCVQGCYDDHPDAVDDFQAAYGCFLDVCGAYCM